MKKKLLDYKFFVLQPFSNATITDRSGGERRIYPETLDTKTFSAELYLDMDYVELYKDFHANNRLTAPLHYTEFCYMIGQIANCMSVDVQPSKY